MAAGRPSDAAIGRCPPPAALATNAAPITTTVSARRNRPEEGSSTCVFHSPHSWRGEDAAARCAPRLAWSPTGMVMVGRLAVDPYQLR